MEADDLGRASTGGEKRRLLVRGVEFYSQFPFGTVQNFNFGIAEILGVLRL